jgi:glyoxylase-like metal-dependent hydrolase (beta-lactamase superfamily II)
MEIAPGIRRLGEGLVNVYLLEEAGEITIVDTGAPGQWKELLAELTAMGRTPDDIRAVVLTHGHSDHIGFAERARRELDVPVSVHEADRTLATGEVGAIRDKVTKGPRPRPLAMLGFLAYSVRKGMLRIPPIHEVATFGDGATLDVPGAPRVILVPGHTAGSAALHVPARDVIFVGDAFATRSALTGARGPLTVPQFNADTRQALASLDRLAELDAGLALPGHGEPWRGSLAEAVRLVRASVPSLAPAAT